MANQKTTMSEESKNDVVQEARELLANAAPGPLELIRYDHGGGRLIKDVDDNGQIQRDLIADFYDAGNREFYSRAREIVSALCDEVQQLRSLNQTQAESIETFQSQFRVMKEAIEATLTFLGAIESDIQEWPKPNSEVLSICKTLGDGSMWNHALLNTDALTEVASQLRSAITPKGSG